MNQLHKNHSPSHQHHQLFTKNNRLYQQIVQNDYLRNEVLQNKKQSSSNIAPIKFNISYQNTAKNLLHMDNQQTQPQNDLNTPKHNNLFKSFESNHPKSHNISNNKSYPQTFSIIEHQNEENSTINIYSLSRNQIEPDLQLSSNNITTKVILEEQAQSSQPFQSAEQSKTSNLILNTSIMQQTPDKNQLSSMSYDEKLKKYRSQEYSYNTSSKLYDNRIQQDEEEGKVPKLLAQKYMKNQISRKFSGSHNSQNDEHNFKAVINQIHIVPYKINNQIKPYGFTIPSQPEKKTPTNPQTFHNSSILPISQLKKSSLKANSLNLNKSHPNQEDIMQYNTIDSAEKKLYFSNHPHHKIPQKISGSFAYHTPTHSQPSKIHRIAPKSQPKYHHNQQKTIRSNSIENKAKPLIGIKVTQQMRENNDMKQNLEHSQVGKLYKTQNRYNPEETQNQIFQAEPHVQFQQESIIYENNAFDICCGFTKNQTNHSKVEKDLPNKINYLPSHIKSNIKQNNTNNKSMNEKLIYENIDINNINSVQHPKGAYKINSIQAIKERNQQNEETKLKKGLKLIGYGVKKIQQ